MQTTSLPRRAFAGILLAASLGFSQGDPLISKNLSLAIADQAGFWVFAADGPRFSRINPAADPLDIRNGTMKIGARIRGGVGRGSTALLFYGYRPTDTSSVGGLAVLTRDGKTAVDTVEFFRPRSKNSDITSGAEFSALAQWRDTAIVAAGRGGIALAKAAGEGRGVLDQDSLIFRALPEGDDTARAALRCKRNAACPAAGLAEIAAKFGEPDSVTALAVDSSADTTWLLIGTRDGLRRGPLGGESFPTVALPAAKPGPIRIESIFADPGRALLWVFSGSEYFFSGDHGRSFHKPPRIAGVSMPPDSLIGSGKPAAAFAGDTTYINLNLSEPGLVAFRKDTLLSNAGTGDLADVLLDKADGLDISREDGRLTSLAALPGPSGTTLLAGSTFRGAYLRRAGGGVWANYNSQIAIKSGLKEVITYPTLFTGAMVDGQPEYVRLGYRLKKDGKVTITVYNYAMEKVKTLVRNASRKGGGNRSEDPAVDRWDGKDASGRHVSVGTYYILVESSSGEKGWGKAIAVRGRGR